VRQVRYSLHSESSIDLALFLNGLPVATAELKTDFTQSVGDAIDQYRFDRHRLCCTNPKRGEFSLTPDEFVRPEIFKKRSWR